jgi:hypothetical protein
MAPNKKKGRSSTNKKKNKGQNRQASRASAPTAFALSSSSASSRSKPAGEAVIGEVPTFHGGDAEKRASAAATSGNYGDSNDSPYERYKKCTAAVRDWLESHRFRVDKVRDLQRAADEIFERSLAYYLKSSSSSADDDNKEAILPIVVPREVMNNLTECIDLREQVSKVYNNVAGDEAGPDKGHWFMIETLKYCRRLLAFSRNVVRVAVADSSGSSSPPAETNDEIGGRFNALLLEVDEDEQEEWEIDMESIRTQEQHVSVAIKAPPEPDHEYTIDDLINGDDRFQACSFIATMDNLMSFVEQHYALLKQVMRGEAGHLHDTSSYVQLMLECTVVANMATESVSVMETALAANHPHLSSFYAVLALVFLYPIIADIEKEIGQCVRNNHPNVAKCFAGDIVECCFRNKGDPAKVHSIVMQFAKVAKIRLSVAQEFAKGIQFSTSLEIQLACEEEKNVQNLSMMKAFGYEPHVWLERFPSLGGDQSFLNTQKMVQHVMDIVEPTTKLVPKPGCFGTMWNESSRPASRIRGEMDQVFAGDILPELIEWAKHQPISVLPNRQELIPVLDILSRHVKNRKIPVPASLTFGLQTILVSFFLLQGDGDVSRLAASSRQSFNKLFEQLLEDSTSKRPQPPTFHRNMAVFTRLRNLTSTAQSELSAADQHAFWNPVIGGEFLLYATYVVSIGLGSVTVDTLGQLRFTLHLYNALRKCTLIRDVEFLTKLDKIFENCKAVWVGGRPDKGNFAKQFYLAWGYSLREASNMSRSAPTFDERKNTAR